MIISMYSEALNVLAVDGQQGALLGRVAADGKTGVNRLMAETATQPHSEWEVFFNAATACISLIIQN